MGRQTGRVWVSNQRSHRRAALDKRRDDVPAISGRTGRVVYLSAEATSRRPGSFWAAVEHAVERSFEEWMFLRLTGFAANTLMWADQIRRDNVVRWVYGQAARSLIDERDIADVAVCALTEPRHNGQRYILTQTVQDITGSRARVALAAHRRSAAPGHMGFSRRESTCPRTR